MKRLEDIHDIGLYMEYDDVCFECGCGQVFVAKESAEWIWCPKCGRCDEANPGVLV